MFGGLFIETWTCVTHPKWSRGELSRRCCVQLYTSFFVEDLTYIRPLTVLLLSSRLFDSTQTTCEPFPFIYVFGPAIRYSYLNYPIIISKHKRGGLLNGYGPNFRCDKSEKFSTCSYRMLHSDPVLLLSRRAGKRERQGPITDTGAVCRTVIPEGV